MGSLGRKFSCLEENGVEFDNHRERVPAAEDVSIDTSTTNTLVGSDVQDVLRQLNRPTVSQKPAYLGNGDVDTITFYKNSTQTTSNRVAVVVLAYSAGLPTTETWTLYSDVNGTTVLKTVVLTYTFTGSDITNTTMVTS